MAVTRAYVLAVAVFLCAAPVRAQSVASLFTSLPADFAHLFTPTNGLIAGVGGAASLAIHPQDDEIADSIADPSGARHDFFSAGATIGDGIQQNAFALGMYVVGRVSHHAGVAWKRRWRVRWGLWAPASWADISSSPPQER